MGFSNMATNKVDEPKKDVAPVVDDPDKLEDEPELSSKSIGT